MALWIRPIPVTIGERREFYRVDAPEGVFYFDEPPTHSPACTGCKAMAIIEGVWDEIQERCETCSRGGGEIIFSKILGHYENNRIVEEGDEKHGNDRRNEK